MAEGLIFGKVSSFDLRSHFWKAKVGKNELVLLAGKSKIILQKLAYPKLLFKRTKNKIKFGYEGEIEFSLKKGGLVLESGISNTVPLYYSTNDRQMLFATNYIDLLPYFPQPITLNLPLTAEYLLLSGYDDKNTLLKNVFLLTERTKLAWDGKRFNLKRPQKKKPQSENLKLTQEQALAQFEKLLNRVIAKKLKELRGVPFGVELSGGLDSSTLTAAIINKARRPIEAFSMILPEAQGRAQLKRLQDFSRKFLCRLNLVKTDNLYPFKNRGKKRGLFYPLEEIYREALVELAKTAKKRGIKIIFTGMGGDELFRLDPRENKGFYGKEELEERRQRKIPSFFTSKIKKAFLDKEYVLPERPVPVVPHSVLSAGHARNNLYIKENVWPVAIFGDSSLVNFCRRLPADLRANKKLFRRYQEKHHFPNSFLTLEKKDSFHPLYELGIKEKEKLFLIELFKNSQLEKLGLVDGKKLIQSYKRYIEGDGPEEHFYGLASLEIFLRGLRQERR